MQPEDIQQIRLTLGMDREVFAQKLGVLPSVVKNWEEGKKTPIAAQIKALETLLAKGMPQG